MLRMKLVECDAAVVGVASATGLSLDILCSVLFGSATCGNAYFRLYFSVLHGLVQTRHGGERFALQIRLGCP